MPWKECKPMHERLKFVARCLEGEKMAVLCREFGISRATGYKIFNRYKACGLDGLQDRSRRPSCNDDVAVSSLSIFTIKPRACSKERLSVELTGHIAQLYPIQNVVVFCIRCCLFGSSQTAGGMQDIR